MIRANRQVELDKIDRHNESLVCDLCWDELACRERPWLQLLAIIRVSIDEEKTPARPCDLFCLLIPLTNSFFILPVVNTLESLREEIARINRTGNGTTGNWSIGQIFFHLAAAFEGSVEGLPPGYHAIIRMLVRPIRWVVTRVKFPQRIPIPSAIRHKLEPPVDADASEQYKRLLQAIDQFTNHEGEYPSHPVLGSLTRDEWIGFHLRHCRHHLNFIQT